MKFSELARFTPARQNGPVTTHRILNVKNLVQFIDENPGTSAGYIARAFGVMSGVISARLRQMCIAKKPYIKRIRQDDLYRFYPVNYKLTTDPPQPEVVTVEKSAPAEPCLELVGKPAISAVVTASIEQQLKDYVWETGVDSAPLHAFLDWRAGNGSK